MGRVERHISIKIKTAAEVAGLLLESCPNISCFEAYMFGSSLKSVGADYDLLFVGGSQAKIIQLKKELQPIEMNLPLDVLFMSSEEAAETDFVVQQGCVLLKNLVLNI